jgi:hypothetical protein
MTPQKAIKELKRQVECWKNGTSFAYSLPPLKVAISALEKQIPKKPYLLNYGGYEVENWRCPNGHIVYQKTHFVSIAVKQFYGRVRNDKWYLRMSVIAM